MSFLTQMPTFVPSSGFYTEPFSEFDEMERPTLSFRQLRVALPHFLFEELFESGKKAKAKTTQSSLATPTFPMATPSQTPVFQKDVAPAARLKQQQQQQQQRFNQYQPQMVASPGPVARNSTRQSRQRSDSESSSSSVDSMKLAGAFAATASGKGARRSPSPSSPTSLRNTESASEQLLMRCIRELPADLRDCFTEWRRERKEAVAAQDLDKQRAVEKVMWNALHSIKSSGFKLQ